MRNLVLIFGLVGILMSSCSKDAANELVGTEWVQNNSRTIKTITFTSDERFSLSYIQKSSGEMLPSSNGYYSFGEGDSENIILMTFDASIFALHEGEISGNTLKFTNLESGQSYGYVKK